jgi:hypothetical protein
MVMGDAADACLHHYLHQRQPERDVHGNGEAVFRDDELDLQTCQCLVQFLVDDAGLVANLVAYLRTAELGAKAVPVEFGDGRVHEVGLRDDVGALGRTIVALTSDVEALVTHAVEHFGPLGDLQADTVGTADAGGHEGDVFGCV